MSSHADMGRYVLGGLLGRGGMAEVFSGHVNGLHGFQKPVAIKRLLPALANDEVFVERLIAEAKLLVGIHHGNIVGVLDLARDDDDVFVVMEYVDGPSLRQLFQARGSHLLAPGVATYIVQSAAAGLEFAHAQPGGAIIHADISPSNLLLTTSGEVRVADFGIARREGNPNGIVEGKWAYMAPEQTRGERLSRSSDVFALGLVLYELLTGQHPFGKTTVRGRGSGPIRIKRPRLLNPNVPPGLDSICMRAVADDPRDRHARMQHLIDALVDERFDNHWREGANELAQAIRDIARGVLPTRQTMLTARPVTLMTRSLIIPVAPDLDEPSAATGTHFFDLASTGTRPMIVEMRPDAVPRGSSPDLDEAPSTSTLAGGSGPLAMPDATGSDPNVPDLGANWRQPKRHPDRVFAASLPRPELATVHGGPCTPTLRDGVRPIVPRSLRTIMIALLGCAVLLGMIVHIATSGDLVVRGSPVVVVAAQPPAPIASQPPVNAASSAPLASTPLPPSTSAAELPPIPTPTAVQSPGTVKELRANTSEHHRPAVDREDKQPAADAMLRVNTIRPDSAWAFADLDGERQEVPGAKFKVTPGRHVVKLNNPKLDLELNCSVTLVPQQTVSLEVDLETGECRVAVR